MTMKIGFALGLGLSVLAGAALADGGKILASYDVNGDGAVTVGELVNIRTYNFNAVDTDGDGAINRDDILAAVKARKLPRAARRDKGFMMEGDRNKDGILTLEEFTDLTALFKLVDRDKDGRLTVDELDASAQILRKNGVE